MKISIILATIILATIILLLRIIKGSEVIKMMMGYGAGSPKPNPKLKEFSLLVPKLKSQSS